MAAKEPVPVPFSVRTEQDGDALVVRPVGELDLSAAEPFEHELRRALTSGASAVFLNLSDVQFIDSTGLRALIAASKLSSQNGGSLRVMRELSPAVERLFELTGMAESLPFAD